MAEETEDLLPTDVRLLRAIRLQNILSFGPQTPELELRALNVLIGPNGSGKSNLLDCIGLLRSAPKKLADTVRTEGSVREWLWKGSENPTARVEAVVYQLDTPLPALRHWFTFKEAAQRFELTQEQIEFAETPENKAEQKLLFGNENGVLTIAHVSMDVDFDDNYPEPPTPTISFERSYRPIKRGDLDAEESILAQRRDPDAYPELTYLGDIYPKISLYREWSFGRGSAARAWQDTAGRNDYLTPNGDNLALMLSRFRNDKKVRKRIEQLLNELYEGITGFETQVFGGRMQVMLEEGDISIPASRLSDGTLRFLSLLVILLHPTPPPLICLEEPELGLHPDAVLVVGRLIKEASERTQLIVTTHSDILVDVLGANPEDILVCEKHEGQTEITRLQESELRGWLQRYSLSQLWTKGKLGGNRW